MGKLPLDHLFDIEKYYHKNSKEIKNSFIKYFGSEHQQYINNKFEKTEINKLAYSITSRLRHSTYVFTSLLKANLNKKYLKKYNITSINQHINDYYNIIMIEKKKTLKFYKKYKDLQNLGILKLTKKDFKSIIPQKDKEQIRSFENRSININNINLSLLSIFIVNIKKLILTKQEYQHLKKSSEIASVCLKESLKLTQAEEILKKTNCDSFEVSFISDYIVNNNCRGFYTNIDDTNFIFINESSNGDIEHTLFHELTHIFLNNFNEKNRYFCEILTEAISIEIENLTQTKTKFPFKKNTKNLYSYSLFLIEKLLKTYKKEITKDIMNQDNQFTNLRNSFGSDNLDTLMSLIKQDQQFIIDSKTPLNPQRISTIYKTMKLYNNKTNLLNYTNKV